MGASNRVYHLLVRCQGLGTFINLYTDSAAVAHERICARAARHHVRYGPLRLRPCPDSVVARRPSSRPRNNQRLGHGERRRPGGRSSSVPTGPQDAMPAVPPTLLVTRSGRRSDTVGLFGRIGRVLVFLGGFPTPPAARGLDARVSCVRSYHTTWFQRKLSNQQGFEGPTRAGHLPTPAQAAGGL